jgi:hypothetical protein
LYPIPDKWLNEQAPVFLHCSGFFNKGNKIYKETEFGEVPCQSRDEFRVNDIMIMQNYKGRDLTEKFLRLTQEHIQAYEKGLWNMLPNAVVIHEPEAL